ncbi:VPLPA-CTERM sorting domain-containing protein [uncultured Roseobacter sp.]|uniref:VPLPA-CTERM sorting domain-containing protein n=1 Tax=uncultured Roseobacter sp. TaxID=114847 RepID=UPI0026307807|nr:VPLPA-CTERM sorting domain-containing protein [uncultured Roseobacter sp.]
MNKFLNAAVLAALLTASASAKAATVLSFKEVGSDVVATLSGSLDLTGATFSNTLAGTNANFIHSGAGLLASGNGLFETQSEYDFTNPGVFGSGLTVFSSFDTTNFSFVLTQNYIRIGAFADDATLSGQIGYNGQSFASLGLSVGQSIFSLSNGDTFTIDVQPSVAPVPLPASSLLLLGGVAGLGLMRRRKKS